MDVSNLKRLRKVVPGTAFLFFCIPAYQYFASEVFSLSEAAEFTLKSYGSVLAFLIGTFFSSLEIRKTRNGKTHAEIIENLKSQLLEHGLTKEVEEEKLKEIKDSKQLMHVFYHFVDKDPSLKEKSKLVKDNGLTWSSTADIAILSMLFSWFYLLLILLFGPIDLFVAAGLLIGLIGFIAGQWLHPISVRKHKKLGDDQIQVIVTIYNDELQEKVNGLF